VTTEKPQENTSAADKKTLAAVTLRKPRSAALAAILSWLVPGLGHVYAGDFRRGALFFALIAGAIAVGLIISGGLAIDIVFHDIAIYGQLGAGGPTLGTAALKYMRDKRTLKPEGRGKLSFSDIKNHREETLKSAYGKRGHINPWHELGLLLTTIAGLLNLLVILDAAETAVTPNRRDGESPQGNTVEPVRKPEDTK